MASKRRIRKQSCGNKIKYDTQQLALNHMFSLIRKDGVKMSAYRCKFCKHWHIGRCNKEKL
jgi:hypothetical protein